MVTGAVGGEDVKGPAADGDGGAAARRPSRRLARRVVVGLAVVEERGVDREQIERIEREIELPGARDGGGVRVDDDGGVGDTASISSARVLDRSSHSLVCH